MQDWLGSEYEVGDKIIYAAMSGRSCTMTIAEVVKFNDSGTVSVRPIRSSRWKQNRGRTKYIDKRTGKPLDPYHNSKGIKTESGWGLSEEGPVLSMQERERLLKSGEKAWKDLVYIGVVFHDWVEIVSNEPGIVTLSVTENITKWTGDIGD